MAGNGKNKALGSNREWSQAAYDKLSAFNNDLTELQQQHADHEGPRSHVNQNIMERLGTMQLNVREMLGMLGHLAPTVEPAAPEEEKQEEGSE